MNTCHTHSWSMAMRGLMSSRLAASSTFNITNHNLVHSRTLKRLSHYVPAVDRCICPLMRVANGNRRPVCRPPALLGCYSNSTVRWYGSDSSHTASVLTDDELADTFGTLEVDPEKEHRRKKKMGKDGRKKRQKEWGTEGRNPQRGRGEKGGKPYNERGGDGRKAWKGRKEGDSRNKEADKWAENFGSLASQEEWKEAENSGTFQEFNPTEMEEEDEEDSRPFRRLAEQGRKNHITWYERQIAKLAKAGKVVEALEFVEVKMLEEDRVKPNTFIFTNLLTALGRVGYTKKAFQLYNKMKKMGIDVAPHCYTALFNACANSPWRQDGLQRADHLRELMEMKGIEPNALNFWAMAKVYAKWGELSTAFSVIDEAARLGHRIPEDAINQLLIACASDREAGFKHAIEIWRRMRKRRIAPSIRTYNLLARCLRDCGLGEPEYAQELLGGNQAKIDPQQAEIKDQHGGGRSELLQLSALNIDEIDEKNVGVDFGQQMAPRDESLIKPNGVEYEGVDRRYPVEVLDGERLQTASEMHLETKAESLPWWKEENPRKKDVISQQTKSTLSVTAMAQIPNILNPKPFPHAAVSLKEMCSATDRLGLLGGLPGFLSHMERDGVSPNVKTFSMLIPALSPAPHAAHDMLMAMGSSGVKPDTDFFNLLIRKNIRDGQYAQAKELLGEITHYQLYPNLHTFGCLAMGCLRRDDGLKLLDDMKDAGFKPNVEIFNALIAKSYDDYKYKLHLVIRMEKNGIEPEQRTIRHLEQFISSAKRMIVKKEHGERVPEHFRSERFHKNFYDFMKVYSQWLKRTDLKETEHPWEQYKPREKTPEEETETEIESPDQEKRRRVVIPQIK